MRKVKLLYVVTKLELGGAQTQLLSLIRNLDRQRFTVYLFTAANALLMADAQAIEGLTIIRSRFLERPIRPVRDVLAFLELYFFLKRRKVDIVHTHSSKAGIIGRFAAAFAGVPNIVHTVHGWSFNDFQSPLRRRLFIALERLASRFTKCLIVVSTADRERGLRQGISSAAHYRLIRYGIDGQWCTDQKGVLRREYGIGPEHPIVGTISCFKPQKSLFDFIEMASLVDRTHPSTRWIIVGDGALRSALVAAIDQRGLAGKVICTGWRRDIPAVMASLDVFALTSLWEGLPISVLEAMKSGVPVVATDTGGVRDVLKDGQNGFLVDCRAPGQLAEKVRRLLDDAPLRTQLGACACAGLGEEFTTRSMVDRTAQLYEQTIGIPT